MASRPLALLTVTVGSILATLNLSSVSVALPSLVRELGGGLDAGKLVLVAYIATVTVLLIPFGRLGDLWGRRRFYALGFLLFAVGASLCSIATSVEQIVAFRVVQAFGAAMLISQGAAILASVYSPGERGQALGWQVLANSVGTIAGYAVGGFIVGALGWRAVFWTNAPVAAVGLLLAWRVLPKGLRGEGAVDRAGMALLALAIALVVIAVNVITPQRASAAVFPFALAALVFGIFALQQRRSTAPLLPPALRGSRLFVMGLLAALFGYTAFGLGSFLAQFFLQNGLGLAPEVAGLIALPSSFAVILLSPASGKLSDRIGGAPLASAGLLVLAVAQLFLANLDSLGALSVAGAALAFALSGAGLGIFASPNNNVVFAAAPKEHLGLANGMLGTMRNLGVSLGATFASLLFLLSAPGHGLPSDPHVFVASMRPALWLGAGLAVTAAALSIARRRMVSAQDALVSLDNR